MPTVSDADASSRATRFVDIGRRLRSSLGDLLSQEFSYSSGHLAAILHGCLFAPSILTFWFVNGVLDFSTAAAVGAVATTAGLQIRLFAYVLLVPVFLLTRLTVHLAHPVHRAQVLSGSCPTTELMSLDWVSLGILATGLPLAIQNFGPWVGMNAVLLVGIFVLPRVLSPRYRPAAKLLAIAAGGAVFIYATYGGAISFLPAPASVLGPVATVSLTDMTTEWLFRLANSIAFGPPLVAAFGVAMNHILTRPELRDLPIIRRTLPHRDSDQVVAASAAFGTTFYLILVAAATGEVVLLP